MNEQLELPGLLFDPSKYIVEGQGVASFLITAQNDEKAAQEADWRVSCGTKPEDYTISEATEDQISRFDHCQEPNRMAEVKGYGPDRCPGCGRKNYSGFKCRACIELDQYEREANERFESRGPVSKINKR